MIVANKMPRTHPDSDPEQKCDTLEAETVYIFLGDIDHCVHLDDITIHYHVADFRDFLQVGQFVSVKQVLRNPVLGCEVPA